MEEPIDEKIGVAGWYEQAKFLPVKFRWRDREYRIEEITLSHDVRDGGVRKRRFGIMAAGNFYRICFDRERETWTLESVWWE